MKRMRVDLRDPHGGSDRGVDSLGGPNDQIHRRFNMSAEKFQWRI